MTTKEEQRLRELIDATVSTGYDYGFAAAAGSQWKMKYLAVGEAREELIDFVRELTEKG